MQQRTYLVTKPWKVDLDTLVCGAVGRSREWVLNKLLPCGSCEPSMLGPSSRHGPHLWIRSYWTGMNERTREGMSEWVGEGLNNAIWNRTGMWKSRDSEWKALVLSSLASYPALRESTLPATALIQARTLHRGRETFKRAALLHSLR